MTNSYHEWKNWCSDSFALCSPLDAEIFKGELSDFSFANKEVLEIGFGNGSFLKWAKDQGAHVAGTELNPHLTQLASQVGFAVIDDLGSEQLHGSFDLVVAFDVLEHISKVDLQNFINTVYSVLKPGGLFLARFPNSMSPMGVLIQHADPTHVTQLSPPILSYYAESAGFVVLEARNSYRPRYKRCSMKWFTHKLSYFFRDTYFFVLRMMFRFGRIPLDPNVTVILKK